MKKNKTQKEAYSANTEYTPGQLELQGLETVKTRKIIVRNDGRTNSSDAGLLLLQQVEQKHRIIEKLSRCFTDKRKQERIKHPLVALLKQRIFGICQGYEDLNDHENLRDDPLLQYVCGRDDKTPTAGKSTLNRLELGHEPDENMGDKYSKITWDAKGIEELLWSLFLDSFENPPKSLILDFDATDISLYGEQQSRFFHKYYNHHCYLPLYVFCDDFPLIARLRSAGIDACDGTEAILKKLVKAIRTRFPDVRIIFRGDSGFCRDSILNECESLGIEYIVGMAKNSRLLKKIEVPMKQAEKLCVQSGQAERVFTRFNWRTHESWSRYRDVIAKAEQLPGRKNPRFIVTNISSKNGDGKSLYEGVYCARGDMENRIKEQQLYLFADRTSTWWMSSNQLRLWFSTIAYIFFVHLRKTIQKASGDETRSMPSTIRLRMLKISAAVKISARRVWISLPESFPWWDIWIKTAQAI